MAAMFSFACKACSNSDKTTDTVKVSFPPPSADDKENAAPEAGQLDKIQEEQRRMEQEEEERRQREKAERLRREQEERMRREEVERQLAAVRRRAEEEERRRKEYEAQRAREAEEELKRRQEEEARRRAEEAKKQEQLGEFLAKNGFACSNYKKVKSGLISSSFTYPLHAAVRAADAQAVGLLLWAGADKSSKDSAKLTPLALAQKLDKKGSHKLVIDALSA